MKRPSDDDERHGSSSDSGAEQSLTLFLERHPKFIRYVGIGIAVLIVVAIVMAIVGSKSQ